jgi:hypothetical protein
MLFERDLGSKRESIVTNLFEVDDTTRVGGWWLGFCYRYSGNFNIGQVGCNGLLQVFSQMLVDPDDIADASFSGGDDLQCHYKIAAQELILQ